MFIELDGWMAKLRFSACHIIPNHPKCGRLHGHTYAVSVRLEGEQEGQFIIDFEELKNLVSGICNELDHRIILAGEDERVKIREDGDYLEVVIPDNSCNPHVSSGKRYVFPCEDAVILPIASVSAEDLCTYINSNISSQLKDKPNITSISVRVDEGIGQGAGCTLKLK